jgi:hypothetical protein
MLVTVIVQEGASASVLRMLQQAALRGAARNEMQDLAREFQELTAKTSVDTPNIDRLEKHV